MDLHQPAIVRQWANAGLAVYAGLRPVFNCSGTMWLVMLVGASAIAQETVLPFIGTDTVTVQRDREQPVTYNGRILDISGESLILQRSGITKTQVFRVSQITQLTFLRSSEFEAGLTDRQAGKFSRALRHFDTAIETELRDWAKRELQAVAAKTCIMMGDRDAAVRRIEAILETDRRSRHASLLPLVWDERLLSEECVSGVASDLQQQDAPAKRLCAASRLLNDERHRGAAKSALIRLSDSSPPRIADLAKAQLWRTALLDDPMELSRQLKTWQSELRRMPLDARSGPQYVIACGLQRQHQHDQASVAFLWMPFMSPTDAALSALSMLAAAHCLKASGRVSEAATTKRELLSRFPKSSAAATLRAEP